MRTALDDVREIYASLPTIDCQGWCWHSCGPIDMSDAERARITDLGVTIPRFTEEAATRWAANERLYCPALKFNDDVPGGIGCSVYEDRPLICRLWGLADGMQCPYGCEPSERLSDLETYELIFEAMKAGGHPMWSEGLRETTLSALGDPESAAALRRFVEGDMSARELAHQAIDKHKGK